MGRFINADALVSTGQGLLGNNMFAYCRNNPVSRKDPTGMLEECTKDSSDDNNPLNDMGGVYHGGAGGGIWRAFMRTLQSAADGLKMASGQKITTVSENHHIFSDKNKTYTPQYKEIAERYDMSLNSQENMLYLQGHKGRHTNAYHDLMLTTLKNLDLIANGNPSIFYEGMAIIKAFIELNPALPYAK